MKITKIENTGSFILHREDNPAVITKAGYEFYYKHGKLYRVDEMLSIALLAGIQVDKNENIKH